MASQLQFAEFQFPYKLNTADPIGMLRPDETPFFLNGWREGTSIVRRRGYQSVGAFSTTNYKFLGSAIQLGDYAAYYLQENGITGYQADRIRQYDRAAEEGTAQVNLGALKTATQYECVVHQLSTGTLTTQTANTEWPHGYVYLSDGAGLFKYNNELWGMTGAYNSNQNALWRVSTLKPTDNNYSLSFTVTQGSTTVTYTGLSTASASLLDLQFTGNDIAASSSGFKIISQNAATSTTGTFELDRPWNFATFGSPTTGYVRPHSHYALSGWRLPFAQTLYSQFADWTCCAIYRDRMFTGTSSGYLLWSKPGNFYETVASNYIKTPLNAITGLIEYDNALYVFSPEKMIKLTGYDESSFSLSPEIANTGCQEQAALKIFNGSLLIPNENGLFIYNGESAPRPLTHPVRNFWVDSFRGLKQDGNDHARVTSVRIVDIQDRFLYVSIFNPFVTTGSYAIYKLLYDSYNDAWSFVSGDTPLGTQDGTSSITRFVRTEFGDDINIFGISAERVHKIGAAFRGALNYYNKNLYSGSGGTTETFTGSTAAQVFFNLEWYLNLERGYTSRIHEAMILHHSSKLNGVLNTLSDGFDITFASETTAGLVTAQVPESGSATDFLDYTAGGTLTAPKYARFVTKDTALEGSIFFIAAAAGSDADVNVSLGSLFLSYENVRQFRVQV